MAYWKDYPPTYVLVAAYLMGGKKGGSEKYRENNPQGKDKPKIQSFHDLTREVTLAGGSMNNKLPEIYRHPGDS